MRAASKVQWRNGCHADSVNETSRREFGVLEIYAPLCDRAEKADIDIEFNIIEFNIEFN